MSGRSVSSGFRAWLQAARPLAQFNIAPPMLFGQALALATTGRFELGLLLWIQLYGLLDQLLIVFTNDWADHATDRTNTTFNRFSGGSRVLVENKLGRHQLAFAARLVLAFVILLALYLAFARQRPLTLWLTLAGVSLIWAYDLRPLRLSYRGGGEVLQALGVGVLLPVLGYYLQSATLAGLPWWVLGSTFLLGYAGNITTALPDFPSDRNSGKRTYPVRNGQRAGRVVSLVLLALAALVPGLGLAGEHPRLRYLACAAPLACVALNLSAVSSADARDRARCTRFVTLNSAAAVLQWLLWSLALGMGSDWN
ncbi:MAG: prenyltransferase [Proteobacteria bacterium]|nr:prenyltransferase [Pseudomonadota bacterium]